MRSWQWPIGPEPLLTFSGAGLAVEPSMEGRSERSSIFIGQETRSLDYISEAVLKLTPGKKVSAGLAVVGDSENALGIQVRDGTNAEWLRRKGREEVSATAALVSGDEVHLRISVRKGYLFTMSESSDGVAWKVLAEPLDVTSIAPWDLGLRIGLDFGEGNQATFSSFEL